MLVLFLLSIGLIAYTYIGFPLLVLARGILLRRPYQTNSMTPKVSILIAAHNEAECIEDKLNNLLAADYPQDRLEILVASDGSDDDTAAIASAYDSAIVHTLALPRGGKAQALNAAAAKSTGEILVFTDANSMFAADALRRLVAPFADPSVGGVAGDQRYTKQAAGSASSIGECAYWSLDRVLKSLESRAGNTISATGAIYAIRRAYFDEVAEGVTDDFATSTAVIEQGARLVFAEKAIAYEPVAGSSRVEFGRKVRVMTRGFRSVWLRRRLLNPFRYGFYSLQLLSHKLLRRLMVFPLILLLISNAALWQFHWSFQVLLCLQLLFYASAALPLVSRMRTPKVVSLPFFFCMANAAAMIAFCQALFGRKVVVWEPQRAS